MALMTENASLRPNHRDCLGSQMKGTSSHLCLLIEKPEGCPQQSFDQLHDIFEGDLCEGQDFPILGGPDSLPPAYLSVPQHRDCLGKIAMNIYEHFYQYSQPYSQVRT